MKNQHLFPAIVLIGFGAYFFMQQSGFQPLEQLYTWPTLLIIVGAAFLCQGYLTKDHEGILPGTILAGFGLHFHLVERLPYWPSDTGTFMVIIALGFLLRYQKSGQGLFYGLLFLLSAIMLLFSDKVGAWFGIVENGVSSAWKFWPILFIAVGAGLLFFKRK